MHLYYTRFFFFFPCVIGYRILGEFGTSTTIMKYFQLQGILIFFHRHGMCKGNCKASSIPPPHTHIKTEKECMAADTNIKLILSVSCNYNAAFSLLFAICSDLEGVVLKYLDLACFKLLISYKTC